MFNNDRELRVNGSGCADPTAYAAIKNVDKKYDEDSEKFYKLIGCIFRVCELAGFSVEGRIALKDNKTGKIWR